MQVVTYVAPSSIHGQGLFAGVDIDQGAVIGHLRGVPSSKDGPHVLWINESEAIEVQCDLKYINHSDQPNACYYDDLSVVALKAIRRGEEITHNYACCDW